MALTDCLEFRLETYIPSEKLAIESGSADENIGNNESIYVSNEGIRLD